MEDKAVQDREDTELKGVSPAATNGHVSEKPGKAKKKRGAVIRNRIVKTVAEFIGTWTLVFIGVGSVVISPVVKFGFMQPATEGDYASNLSIAICFGLAIVAMAYSIGNVSGAHVNPAVSAAVFLAGRMDLIDMLLYWLAQFSGALFGAGCVYGIVQGDPDYSLAIVGMASNGYGMGYGDGYVLGSCFAIELLTSALFYIVVLGSTGKGTTVNAGLAIGLTLTAIHIMTIPVTGCSVNPARSFASAVIAGGKALQQVWLFFAAPFLASIIVGLVYRFKLLELIDEDECSQEKEKIEKAV